MSKLKSSSLGSLQKEIVMTLATGEPCTMNEAATRLKKTYKSVHTAFKALKSKELIKAGKKKYYRGNEYPTYWLTNDGAILALAYGVDPDLMREQAQKHLGKIDGVVEISIEGTKIFGREVIGTLILDVFFKRSFKFMQFPPNDQQLKQFYRVLMKYPKSRQLIKQIFKTFEEYMGELPDDTREIFIKDMKSWLEK